MAKRRKFRIGDKVKVVGMSRVTYALGVKDEFGLPEQGLGNGGEEEIGRFVFTHSAGDQGCDFSLADLFRETFALP